MKEKSQPEASDDLEKAFTPSLRLDENSRQALVTASTAADASNESDVLQLLRETTKDDIDNPFAFSPAVLDKLFNPKSLHVFFALGGLTGLEHGLRTDTHSGLSADEDLLAERVTFEDVTGKSADIRPSRITTHQRQISKTSLPLSRRHHGSFTDRKKIFKDNHLPAAKSQGFLSLVWATYNDKVLILLTVAAIISLAIGIYQSLDTSLAAGEPRVEWVEGVAIVIAIVIITLVGSVNDFQKEKQFQELNKKKQSRDVVVIRSGKMQKISIFDVLVGDIVHLEPGDVVPADGIFIEGYNVQCDESLITGESDLIRKNAADEVFQAMQNRRAYESLDPFIFSGAKVAEGIGTYLVTATGTNSSYAKILEVLNEDPKVTPLQMRLDRLAKRIANIGAILATVMFVITFIKFAVQLRHNHSTPTQKGQQFLNVLIIALTVLIIAVPEGLPLAVTLALAFATRKMVQDHNLVRRLKSCETMGNVTSICSDKTGTLTQNQMRVVMGTIGRLLPFTDQTDEASLNATNPDAEKEMLSGKAEPVRLSEVRRRLHSSVRDLLAQLIAINSTAFEDGNDEKQPFVGSKTETALLGFARQQLAMGSVAIERSNAHVVYSLPFHNENQFQATVVGLENGQYRLYVKGAPEVLLNKCSQTVANPSEQLTATAITPEDKEILQAIIKTYASRSLRTIGLMYRDFEEWPPKADEVDIVPDDFLHDLVFLALVGIQDPLRPEVRDAVRACQRAGVVVRMVTGDNVFTARAIAEDSGILEGGSVMEGTEFRSLSDTQMDEIIPRLRVLARASPADKRVLAKRLREKGETVAVTGDGTNDAPALAAADIGISMGISATEVAKEAADIILMDDNFRSIVKAIMWGRAINDSVKKFLQFQVTITVTSVGLAFISAISSSQEQSVLTPVQLMWINLIQDTLAALALATDGPTPTILDRKPEAKMAPLITSTMWKMIVGQSVYQLAVLLVLYYGGDGIFSYHTAYQKDQLQSAIFATYVWMQIFNQINCRRMDNKLNIFEGAHRNWLFISISLIETGIQILIMFVGGTAFSITRMDGGQWAYSLVLGALSIPVGVLIRLVPFEVLGVPLEALLGALRKCLPRMPRRKRDQAALGASDSGEQP